jgi:hypothetical protein
MDTPTLMELSDGVILARLDGLLSTESGCVVDFLLVLAETERRQVLIRDGYSSVFKYLTEGLRLPDGSAWLRMVGARLIARFPVIEDYLRSRRLCLSTLARLRDVLTDQNHEEVLERAAGRSEEQVKEMVAEMAPRPVPASTIRKVPVRVSAARPLELAVGSAAEVARAEVRRAKIELVARETYSFRFAASKDFKDDYERVKAALSHVVPDGDLEKVMHECVKRTLAQLEKRRPVKAKTAVNKEPAKKRPDRYVPAAVARAVFERDEGRCACVGPAGKRCGETRWVQVHHIEPVGMDGPSTVANCALRCQRHNLYEANRDYGAELMTAMRAASR